MSCAGVMLSLMTFLPISIDRKLSEDAQAELEANKRVKERFFGLSLTSSVRSTTIAQAG